MLAAAAAALLGAALAAPAQAEDTVRVGKAVAYAFSFSPLDVGIAAGLFEKHGLKVEISSFSGAARLQQALAANGVDIGLGGGVDLAFVAKGAPVTGIASIAGPPLMFGIMVPKDSPIKTIADLKGKLIGKSTTGSVTEWLPRELSIRQGWGPDGIKTVALGVETAQVAAMKTKQIDGAVVEMGAAQRLVEAGEIRVLVKFGDLIKDYITQGMYARRDFLAAHPDTVRAFLAAWIESLAYMRDHKPETVAVAMKVMNVSEAVASRTYDEQMPMFTMDGHYPPEGLKVLARSVVEMGILPTAPDMSKLYTEDYLPKR
jgi:ABC-type nitrate/sulfonate/bicarbonate transport system substrate-binding protein